MSGFAAACAALDAAQAKRMAQFDKVDLSKPITGVTLAVAEKSRRRQERYSAWPRVELNTARLGARGRPLVYGL